VSVVITETPKFWRFHPVTGADANDFTDELKGATPKQKQDLAEMVRQGAKFYWGLDRTAEGYQRIERSNVEFVLKVIGEVGEWIESAPAQPAGEDS
jgi:hypothetical protein